MSEGHISICYRARTSTNTSGTPLYFMVGKIMVPILACRVFESQFGMKKNNEKRKKLQLTQALLDKIYGTWTGTGTGIK
jgi:hypothetical protein